MRNTWMIKLYARLTTKLIKPRDYKNILRVLKNNEALNVSHNFTH
jgi:hypothetical protein